MRDAPPDMKLRLSTDLRRKIEEAAKRNNRTLNAEIVMRLEQAFATDGTWLDAVNASPSVRAERSLLALEARLADRIEDLEARMQALEAKA